VATIESWLGQVRTRRARRALARQWAYQQRTVGPLGAAEVLAYITRNARAARALVESVAPMARVLAPGGVLYFTVNVHHPVYRVAALAHAAWASLGIPVEIGPFADHTVHLTLRQARRLVRSLPVQVALERDGVAAARSRDRRRPPRHVGDRLTRLFFKNARYQVVARRLAPEPAAALARKPL
jgi:hypothetical protein